jgi:hypothetical protein
MSQLLRNTHTHNSNALCVHQKELVHVNETDVHSTPLSINTSLIWWGALCLWFCVLPAAAVVVWVMLVVRWVVAA